MTDMGARRQTPVDALEDAQAALVRAQYRFSNDDPEFYALAFAVEAVRLAWYVVARHEDGGKLANVRAALAAVERALDGGEARRE